jgi:hypothetical protein
MIYTLRYLICDLGRTGHTTNEKVRTAISKSIVKLKENMDDRESDIPNTVETTASHEIMFTCTLIQS